MTNKAIKKQLMEKKDIKDYLHLYLGCTLKSKTGTVILMSVIAEIIPLTNWGIAVLNGNQSYTTELGDYKPVLRPLSDISPKEIANLIGVYDMAIEKGNYESPFFQIQYRDENNEQQYKHAYLTQLSPEQFLFLLSNHFDLFGLIESGLAINKTTLNE